MISSFETYLLVCGLLFVAGLFLGRFLNRCVLRLPEHFHALPAWKHVFDKETRKGHYPATRWYHRLPVIGTASIVGRSPYSGRRVLKREPWLELLNGLLVLLTFVCTIPPEMWGGIDASTIQSALWAKNLFGWTDLSSWFLWGRFLYFLILVEALYVSTFIDFDLWIIPDGATVPAMIAGFAGQLLGVGFFLTPVWVQDPELVRLGQQLVPLLQDWPITGWIPRWVHQHHIGHAAAVSAAGFIVGGGIVWAVRIIGGLVLRREAMGFGDVILMAMIGAFIGWQPVTIVFFLAPLMALIVLALISVMRFLSLLKLPPELPYGPYLSLATLVVLFGWKWIWPSVERFFYLGPLLIILAALMLVVLTVTLLLLQGLKRLAGIAAWEDEIPTWGSADQLLYQAGERADERQGNWKRPEWRGSAAGRGRLSELQWKDGCR